MKNIVFTGGGTAGHIMPNLAIINDLQGYNIFYIGTNAMEKNIISQYPNIKFIEIDGVKFERRLTPKNLLIPFKLLKTISATKKILQKIKPSITFSKGGYVSIPVCLASNKLGIPVLTHESDLTIGLANKIIAKKSKHLLCSFESTAKKYSKNAIFTGSPIRKNILNGNPNIIKIRHNLNTNKPIITIVGGSQGAKAINECVWNNIDKLTEKFTIIHIVGNKNLNANTSNSNSYIQIKFAKDIENYFAISDMVITRAGSNTIFELLAIHKPMLLIPLPKSSNSRGDQEDNAKYFEEYGYANTLSQNNLTINSLLDKINETLINKYGYIKKMKNAPNTIGNKKIIDLINTISNKNPDIK